MCIHLEANGVVLIWNSTQYRSVQYLCLFIRVRLDLGYYFIKFDEFSSLQKKKRGGLCNTHSTPWINAMQKNNLWVKSLNVSIQGKVTKVRDSIYLENYFVQ
mmetsp:Transcript_31372/g.31639  ORF Transcript_31372/g.31639 Transcript_31372/m.31639 type:complete len:102 (-) Transcript_31372:14-319(-)